MRRLELILGISFALVACRERTREPEPESLIEDVRIAGCEQIRRGPICEIENDTKVVLWVQAAPESKLTVDGTEVEWTEVDGGWRTTFEVTTATKSIDVVATRKGRDKYALPVVVWKRPPWLVKADALRTKSATAALAILDANEEGADVRTLADVATMRARIAFYLGDYDAAVQLRRSSADLAERSALVAKPILDFQSIAFIAIAVIRDVDLARDALLEVSRQLPDSIGAERAYTDYYEAMLARETGDTRRAIRFSRSAERLGLRLDDPVAADAIQLRAEVLGTLGLHSQVARIYEAIGDLDSTLPNPCSVARFLGNRAWATLRARSGGVDARSDIVSDATRALTIYETTCPNPANVFNLHINLALEALRVSAIGTAKSHLRAAADQSGGRSTEAMAWRHVAEAEIALIEGRQSDFRSSCDALSALGERVGSTPLVWRATLCRARGYESAGQVRKSIAAYRDAEHHLDTALTIPFSGPGLGFDREVRDRAARRHAELLVRAGRTKEGILVLDRHALRERRGLERGFRVASLRGEERRVWERAAMRYAALRGRLDALNDAAWSDAATQQRDRAQERGDIEAEIHESHDDALALFRSRSSNNEEIDSPRADELVLRIDRLRDDWIAFAETSSSTHFARLPGSLLSGSDEALARQLLEPLSEVLDSTKSVRIIARGRSHEIDVHRLHWRGRALVASHSVTYSAEGRQGPLNAAPTRAALIVEDPTGNLPSARDEAQRVAAALEELGWVAHRIAGRRATRNRLNGVIDRVSLLHWAGHGRDDPEVGFSASLPLAGGAVLDVGDILALAAVPDTVVLSGCATAPPQMHEIGPARAFVLAGAHEVLATTRAVRDRDAAAITGTLYVQPTDTLAAALARAQVQAAESAVNSDWAAFRVYVP